MNNTGDEIIDSYYNQYNCTHKIKMFTNQIEHSFDKTIPPPVIDDSFPHPMLLEQLRESDKVLLQRFLSSRTNKALPAGQNRKGKVFVDIATYRSELRDALLALEELKHSKMFLEELRISQEDSDRKWNDELDRTEQLQCTIQEKLNALEDIGRITSLTRKLSALKKKRAWQKRRNLRLKKEREEHQAERERRMEEMSRWENEWKDRLEKEHTAREEFQAKTLILADVRRRKARAKRYVNRFEKTIQLHQQRQNVAMDSTGGGSCRKATDERFRKDINALIAEWKSKLTECIREEKQLKDELARRSAGNENRRRDNRWRKALFGDAAALVNGRTKSSGYDDIIETRWSWDAYALPTNAADAATQCISAEKGYPVPTEWILPPENPLPEWAMFKEATKIKVGKKVAVCGKG